MIDRKGAYPQDKRNRQRSSAEENNISCRAETCIAACFPVSRYSLCNCQKMLNKIPARSCHMRCKGKTELAAEGGLVPKKAELAVLINQNDIGNGIQLYIVREKGNGRKL
jgi:hypothetical protein